MTRDKHKHERLQERPQAAEPPAGQPPPEAPAAGAPPAEAPTAAAGAAPQTPPAEAPAPAEPPPEAQLEAVRKERDDYLARLQRACADYQNYQKRVRRDMEQAREYANEQLIKALLEVLDDLERALEAGRTGRSDDDPFLAGAQLVCDKALATLKRFGLEPIEAEGRPFDPELHSAMMQEPRGDCPPKTVVRQLMRGYRLKGRVIRPARVVVSAAPDQAAHEATPSGDSPPA